MRRAAQTAAIFASLVMALASAWAAGDRYEKGKEALEAGNDLQAEAHWVTAGRAGDWRAQLRLGQLYDGWGDFDTAVDWYRLAADAGIATAQFNLGNAYFRGRGVDQDVEQAIQWWREAANRGSAPAQFNLGTQYLIGDITGVDPDRAEYWYKRAAGNQHPRAGLALKQLQEVRASQGVEPLPPVDRIIESPPDAAPPPEHSPSDDNDSIASQADDDFCIQLIVLSDADVLTKFMAGLDGLTNLKLSRYRTQSADGISRFGLVAGPFADREEAVVAIKALPPELKRLDPWPRRYGELRLILAD